MKRHTRVFWERFWEKNSKNGIAVQSDRYFATRLNCSNSCIGKWRRQCKIKMCPLSRPWNKGGAVACDYCGKLFHRPPSRINKYGNGSFCGFACWCNFKSGTIECALCGKSFHVTSTQMKRGRKYCGNECYHKARQRQVKRSNMKCEICGKVFHVGPYDRKRGRGHFCSRKCFGIAHRGRKIPWVESTCNFCNKVFEQPRFRAKHKNTYCSRKCYRDWQKSRWVRLKCEACGKPIKRRACEIRQARKEGRQHVFCTRKCAINSPILFNNRWQGGPSHFKWRGGRRLNKNGYVELRFSGLSDADKALAESMRQEGNGGVVLEHRLIAARERGFAITPQELVHHINGIKDDNRPQNLFVFPSIDEHNQGYTRLLHKAREALAENEQLRQQITTLEGATPCSR